MRLTRVTYETLPCCAGFDYSLVSSHFSLFFYGRLMAPVLVTHRAIVAHRRARYEVCPRHCRDIYAEASLLSNVLAYLQPGLVLGPSCGRRIRIVQGRAFTRRDRTRFLYYFRHSHLFRTLPSSPVSRYHFLGVY